MVDVELLVARVLAFDGSEDWREADEDLTARALGGDPVCQRASLNLLARLWEEGALADLDYARRALRVARIAADTDPDAKRHMACLLHLEACALRAQGNDSLADCSDAEAVELLDRLSDAGLEKAGEDLAALTPRIPVRVLKEAADIRSILRDPVQPVADGVAPPPPPLTRSPVASPEPEPDRWDIEAEKALARQIAEQFDLDWLAVWDALADVPPNMAHLISSPEGWTVLGEVVARMLGGFSPGTAVAPQVH